MTAFPYEANTDGMIVRVRPQWLARESDPSNGKFIWAYQVEIENIGPMNWTLRRRHWKIIDANGHIRTVDGDGVVGQMPTLKTGESYKYTSGVPLNAPSGIMSGHYEFDNTHAEILCAKVPAFSLDSPYDKSRPS